jgi:hypothetical protein
MNDKCQHVLVENPECKRPFLRNRRRFMDNIKMDLREIGCDVNWVHLAQESNQ